MEPNYVGQNGRIDAMAAAWLLDEDHVFFLDNEITWDGQNHSFTGAQLNAGNMDEVPVFMSNYEMLMNGVIDLMTTLEGDNALRVPREAINPSLHEAIREGDLTGITLFNLIACGHAIRILNTQENVYRVMYDNRLARGIPAFYKLVTRMIWDMREYNGIEGPFQVAFASARNIDADQYLRDFNGMVPGAVSEPMWMEEANGAPVVELLAESEVTNYAEENAQGFASGFDAPTDMQADEEHFERLAIEEAEPIVAAGEPSGEEVNLTSLLSDDLGALNDLADSLADEMGVSREEFDAMAEKTDEKTKVGGWTFEQGKTAKGRRFSIGLPDQYAAVEDCGGRPLAVPVDNLREGEDADYFESPQVIYSDILGDLNDETREIYLGAFVPEARIQMSRQTLYSNTQSPMGGGVVDDWVVNGKNCQVQVFDVELPPFFGPPSHEYYVKPVVYDHEDQLRITDSCSNLAPGELKELAFAIAKTVELDKPMELKRVSELGRYQKEVADLDAFTEMVNAVSNILIMSTGWRINGHCWRERRNVGDDIQAFSDGVPSLMAEAFNEALADRVEYFEAFVDALEGQKRLGAADYDAMWKLVGEAGDMLMVDHLEIDGDEEMSASANATGLIKIPEKYQELRNKWQALQ